MRSRLLYSIHLSEAVWKQRQRAATGEARAILRKDARPQRLPRGVQMAQTLVVGFRPHDMRPGVTQASAIPGLGTDSPKVFFYSLSPLECWPSPRRESPRDTCDNTEFG